MATIKSPISLRAAKKRKLAASTFLGIIFLTMAVILTILDPFFMMLNHNLRLANSSAFCDLLANGIEGGKLDVYLFNITNADTFLTGEDYKLKVKEVGPFTYKEFRTTENMEFDPEAGVMRYTPRYEPSFVPEESIASPENVTLTLPNVPFLSAAALMSSNPSFIRNLYSMLASQLGSKAVVKMDVHNYLWGYHEPLITLANTIMPGLIYFKTIGMMDRLYDREIDYRLELGTTDADKFSIKSMKKYRRTQRWSPEDLPESTTNFTDTYEGMGYCSGLTPDTPIHIYRPGVCRLFEFEFHERSVSKYGAEAFVYKFSKNMFSNKTMCTSQGPCPDGTLDMSPCVFGLPFAMSKGHFLDGDPKLFERIEGLEPDEKTHSSYLLIDPKISLTLEMSMSIQINIVLGDVSYNSQAQMFSNMVVPIAHVKVTQPNLPKEADEAITLTYLYGPYIMISSQIILFTSAFLLLAYPIRFMYLRWLYSGGKEILYGPEFVNPANVELPLLLKEMVS